MDTNRLIVKYGYNQQAIKTGGFKSQANHDLVLRKLISSLKPKAKILDIGCGGGIPVTKFLADKGFEVMGIDLAEEQIKHAKNQVPAAKFHVMDMAFLNLPPNTFDAIICFDSLYHVERNEHAKIIKNFSDILVDNGILAITLPIMAKEEVRYMFENILMYWSYFGEKRNLDMILDAGFIPYHKEAYLQGNLKQILLLAEKVVIGSK